jgi:hypothetical protein
MVRALIGDERTTETRSIFVTKERKKRRHKKKEETQQRNEWPTRNENGKDRKPSSCYVSSTSKEHPASKPPSSREPGKIVTFELGGFKSSRFGYDALDCLDVFKRRSRDRE